MGTVKSKEQLQVLSQVGSWVLTSDELRARFAGVHKGKAAFKLFRRKVVTEDGEKKTIYRIQSLVDGLILKTRDEPEKKGTPGDYWDLEDKILSESTIRLGKMNWCFRWASIPFHMALTAETPESWLETDEETLKFRRITVSLGISLLLLLAILQVMPEIKTEPKILYSEAVTLAIPKAASFGGADTRPLRRTKVSTTEMAQQAISQSIPTPSTAKPEIEVKSKIKAIPPSPKEAQIKPERAPPAPSLEAKALKSELTAALSMFSHPAGTANTNNTAKQTDSTSRGAAILDSIHGKSGNSSRGIRISGGANGATGPKQVTLGGVGKGVGYGSGVHAKVSGQGGGMLPMDLGGLKVNQGLTHDEVGAVIQGHMDEIRYCYEHAKVHSAYVDGKIQTFFTINSSGSVVTEKTLSSTVSSSILEDCVLRKLKAWRFPRPRGGVQVDVSYPFVFRTIGAQGYD